MKNETWWKFKVVWKFFPLIVHILQTGAQREKINNGLEFFRILSHQNKIGEEPDQMKFLLRIIREMRP